jgi:uncharacterized protein YyaL (SSP411 family)
MSVWLTPDLKPFYGGTYFPPRDNFGRPGFPAILKFISDVRDSHLLFTHPRNGIPNEMIL